MVKDLGVTITPYLSFTEHMYNIVKDGRQHAGWILRTFKTREKYALRTLFKSLVLSRLEYCSPLWSPHLIKDITSLESVQRSFTSKITAVHGLNYWERLKYLKLYSLQRRRERFIIIYMWKIYMGMYPNDLNIQFYWNDRLGPCAMIPNLKSKYSSINTLRFNLSLIHI